MGRFFTLVLCSLNELVDSEALKRHNDVFYMKKYRRFSGGFLSNIASK